MGLFSSTVAAMLALATPALPAAAAQAPAAARPSAPALALAREAVTAEDVAGPAAAAQVRTMLAGVIGAHAEMAAIERESPGLLANVIEAGMPILLDSARTRLPALHERLARLYDERLTPAQIAEVSAFFASPLGRRYSAALRKGADVSRSTESMARSSDLTPDPAAVVADVERTTQAGLARLTPDDRAAVLRLSGTPAFTAFNALTRPSAEVQLDWGGEYLPGEEERLQKVMTRAVEAHVAGAGG